MNELYFAEFETDKFIRKTYFDGVEKGVMVEVGGGTPEWISMSRHFKINGWRCIIVEPNPKFVKQHQDIGNEVYQYACSYEEKDDCDFEIVHYCSRNGEIDDHSFSAIKVKENYMIREGVSTLSKTIVKTNIRKLDTILIKASIDYVDFISIDVEGWELEVMKGFDTTKFKPKVVLLENFCFDNAYIEYMNNIGYKLDHSIQYNYIFIKK